jgi:hypothetical protein
LKVTTLALAVAAIVSTAPALADSIEVNYTATVSNALGTNNSIYADGTTISGQFFINEATEAVTSSTLGIYSAPNSGPYSSSANTGNDGFDAVYELGTYVSSGAPSNSSISVDFSALSSFAVTDPVQFLLQGGLAQADFTGAASTGFPSTVALLNAAGDGTLNGPNLTAYIDSATETPVPLPGGLWLMLSGTGSLFIAARRRRVIG